MTLQREDQNHITIDCVRGVWDRLSGSIGVGSSIEICRARDCEDEYREDMLRLANRLAGRAIGEYSVLRVDQIWRPGPDGVKEHANLRGRVTSVDMFSGDSNSRDIAMDRLVFEVESVNGGSR